MYDGNDNDDDDEVSYVWSCLYTELHNVNFFTQIISVQLNLPKKKRVNCEKFLTFKVLNGHKKQILGQKYQKLYLECCFEEKCHCSC